MNLGHTIGSAVRDQIREVVPVRSHTAGYWHQIGKVTIERVRTVVEELDPLHHEIWLTQTDERTCPTCGQLDGRIWPEGEGFAPPAHDHCRCVRNYHHTVFRRRLIEQWRDIAVSRTSWEWRKE